MFVWTISFKVNVVMFDIDCEPERYSGLMLNCYTH